jgi:hypothetical protein
MIIAEVGQGHMIIAEVGQGHQIQKEAHHLLDLQFLYVAIERLEFEVLISDLLWVGVSLQFE